MSDATGFERTEVTLRTHDAPLCWVELWSGFVIKGPQ